MSKTMTLADAMKDKIVCIGHYFVTTMPKDRCAIVMEGRVGWKERQKFQISAGEQKLWRLEEGLKMWGEPTKEKLVLQGIEGFSEGPYTMHRIMRKLYSIPGVFNQVRACSLPKEDYFFSDLNEIVQKEGKKYSRLGEDKMHYWLASRRIYIKDGETSFLIFAVDGIHFGNYWLGNSNGDAIEREGAIRPEAIPNPKLLIENDSRSDGSKEHPWRILNK